MAELVLRLVVDPVTGKKTLIADYHSDADALPSEHEEEHRRLVKKVVEGTPLDASGGLAVDRPDKGATDVVPESPEATREAEPQKS